MQNSFQQTSLSDSDTGGKFRFKIKHIEPTANVQGSTTSGDNTLFTAPAQKTDRHKKIKNKRKRRTSPESLSSDLENSSSSQDPVEKGISTKSHRFQIISKSKSHKKELPGEMTYYVNHQFECVFFWIKKLDRFVKPIMGQNAQVLNQGTTAEKFQQKVLDVIGPLSKLWKRLEDIKMPQIILCQCLLKITLS